MKKKSKDIIALDGGGEISDDTVVVLLAVKGKLRENIEKIYLEEPHFDNDTHDYIIPVMVQYKKGYLQKIKDAM